jgi:hypothetical protein
MYHSIACRLLCAHGAHINPDSPAMADTRQKGTEYMNSLHRRLRELFWICYMFDKDISLHIGQPPSINDGHCDLTLPSEYLNGDYDTLVNFEEGPMVIGDLRLTFIKSKASQLLYSAAAFGKSDAELLKDIRLLDEELEEWRVSISPQYRPALSLTPNYRTEAMDNKAKRMHVAIMHFEYYYIMSIIHSASGRCRAWTNDECTESSGMTSSQAIAVQASRSTVMHMRTIHELVNPHTFW